MAVRGTKDYLVGVNKTLNNHIADIGNMMFMKSQFVTSLNVICFKRTDIDMFNQGVWLLAKNWRSQFATSKYQKTLWSQFATIENGVNYHFLEITKMIICSRNFRPQNHFVGANKMTYMFGGKNG